MNILISRILNTETFLLAAPNNNVIITKTKKGYGCQHDSGYQLRDTIKIAISSYLSDHGYSVKLSEVKQVWNKKEFKALNETYISENKTYKLKAMYCVFDAKQLEVQQEVENNYPMEPEVIKTPQPLNWLHLLASSAVSRLLSLQFTPTKKVDKKRFKSVMAEVCYLYRKVYVAHWQKLWQRWSA